MRRKWLRGLGVVLLLLGVAWAWASVDRCGAWSPAPAALAGLGRAAGPLRVGAAVVAVSPAYPVTVGGYGPPRGTATSAVAPVSARALVLEAGGQPVALVAVDTLLVTAALADAVQADAGLPVWLVATHTHSSLGGYDARLAVEVAALGAYRAQDEAAVADAAKAAVAQARARLAPVRFEVSTIEAQGLSVARSGPVAEQSLTRVRFLGEAGPVAQWLVLSAHPTLVPRRGDALDPDWPGRLAAREEQDGGPVTLVMQGAGGNASVDRATASTPQAFAEAVGAALKTIPPTPTQDSAELAWARVSVGLSHPDASRLAPWPLRAAAENVLCEEAETVAVVSALRLGNATFLFVPVEPSHAAGQVLAEQAGARRVVGLANGYLGYVEPEGVAREGGGESKKQYFDVGYLGRLSDAARLAGQAVAPAR